jgi:hypothetical protein
MASRPLTLITGERVNAIHSEGAWRSERLVANETVSNTSANTVICQIHLPKGATTDRFMSISETLRGVEPQRQRHHGIPRTMLESIGHCAILNRTETSLRFDPGAIRQTVRNGTARHMAEVATIAFFCVISSGPSV